MKVCVVGAGPCGLTTIKQLLDEGHEVVCFDKNPDIGGIWLRHDGDGATMKAYDDLYLTISMKLMAYSDYPFRGVRMFYSRAQYLEYLRAYADRFGLGGRIRFASEVTNVERVEQHWVVSVRREGIDSRELFDAVAVCSGPFKTPNRASAGLEDFAGEIVHSAEYRNSDRFRGKRVLIVGLAESGADIVRQIGGVASACTLSIRSYTYLLPRVSDRRRTTDHGTVRAHHHEMYRRATTYPLVLESFWGRDPLAKALFLVMTVVYGVAAMVLGALGAYRERSGARPTTNPMGEPVEPAKLDLGTLDNDENWHLIETWNRRSHPDGSWSPRRIFCKNVSFIPAIAAGRVTLNDSGIAKADGSRIVFEDSSVGEFDTVVLCTGFEHDFSIGELRVKDGNVGNLYKHFLLPDHQGTVAFIGLIRPFSGGIPVCAEMQARYFARVCSGKQRVPDHLDELIARDKQWEDHWTSLSPNQTESIPSQVLYLDALAREIGCLVPMSKMLFNPKLFIQLWFGSFNPSSYQIVGPHNLGSAALTDLYSEPVENRRDMVLRHIVLQLAPPSFHPKHLMGRPQLNWAGDPLLGARYALSGPLTGGLVSERVVR
ncbi:NAD(P)-binding domain-containing protein [Mycobacterium sp. CVI_P3]|uniref:NAD(P)-binding domain-containing protein n=1 Tax=Mycobacterium pinniadriaticum TaxID=2994102 RepID=A0ABT3SHK0_9MYCO|nr:NAD(P)-binding domain-containing protein [Mycobacterium pinniadriaticum]MCX2932567.1 NAD(P)-binding domain-containing protein [Mycobacterium pinniadriaticum]MCX2938989.1 NAD(P)-binding domain-containing protein [Mycobacterium pinniadriaticum]